MISIWELANPQLREITVYQPGKPIEETAPRSNRNRQAGFERESAGPIS